MFIPADIDNPEIKDALLDSVFEALETRPVEAAIAALVRYAGSACPEADQWAHEALDVAVAEQRVTVPRIRCPLAFSTRTPTTADVDEIGDAIATTCAQFDGRVTYASLVVNLFRLAMILGSVCGEDPDSTWLHEVLADGVAAGQKADGPAAWLQ